MEIDTTTEILTTNEKYKKHDFKFIRTDPEKKRFYFIFMKYLGTSRNRPIDEVV